MAENNVRREFHPPKTVKIMGRSSSITNSFVNGIIPIVLPTDSEIREALKILGMVPGSVKCAYCGDPQTEWDHLRPLVQDKRPTGYITEIRNLVPACGKCNQSKGNKDWQSWMLGPAKLSPKTRNIEDLEERIDKLKAYCAWGQPQKIDICSIIGEEKWDAHWENLQNIIGTMRNAQILADEIRSIIRDAVS